MHVDPADAGFDGSLYNAVGCEHGVIDNFLFSTELAVGWKRAGYV